MEECSNEEVVIHKMNTNDNRKTKVYMIWINGNNTFCLNINNGNNRIKKNIMSTSFVKWLDLRY